MSYTLYNVDGFILGSYAASESSSIIYVLTAELGLIRVWGQGTRKINSKLVPHVQDLTIARLVVVRGREYWRLTDAEKKQDYHVILSEKHTRSLAIRVIQMLNRLAHEGVDEDVYSITQSLFNTLLERDYSQQQTQSLEIVFMLRLLHVLGYGGVRYVEDLFSLDRWDSEVIGSVMKNKKALVQSINDSLRETQL